MNTTHRSVWNAVTRTFVAAAETAKCSGKGRNGRAAVVALAMAAFLTGAGTAGGAFAQSTVPSTDGTVSIGTSSQAVGDGATAVGGYSLANGAMATVFGVGAKATQEAALALGAWSVASGVQSSALGTGASAAGDYSTALGAWSVASGLHANAIGMSSNAAGDYSTALGAWSKVDATARQSVALGMGSHASSANSVALGAGSSTTEDNTVSVGSAGDSGFTRRITNVSDGTGDSDAATVRQLNATQAGVSRTASDLVTLNSSIAGGTVGLVQQDAASQKITVGKTTNGTSVDLTGTAGARQLSGVANGAVDAGSLNAVNGGQLYSTGSSVAKALGGGSIINPDGTVGAPKYQMGGTTQRTVGDALANVDGRVTTNTSAVSATQGDVSDLQGNVANLRGQASQAVTYDSTTHDRVTLGGMSATTPSRLSNIAKGDVSATSTDAVNGAQLDATNGRIENTAADLAALNTSISGGSVGLVQQDATSGKITVGQSAKGTAVDLTGSDGARQLSGVANGAVGASSRDAVNGGQLYGTSSSVAKALGGGSVVNPDGTVGAPKYEVGGTTQRTVGGAITNIDGRVTTNSSAIAGLQGDVGNAVMYDSPNRDHVTLGGKSASQAVKLSNIAAGDVSDTSTDAVNGSQLNATNVRVERNTTDIESLNTSITSGNIGLVQQDSVTRNLTVGKSTDGTAVDFTGTLGARQLGGVADGTVAPGSLFAINGGQLHSTSSSVAKALGAGSRVNTDGTITAPSYTAGGQTYNNVGGAISNLDGRVTSIESSVSNVAGQIESGQIGLVKQDPTTGAITVGADKGGSTVDITGEKGGRTVTGVADGAIAAGSTDAVNGGQIYSLNEQLTALNNGLSVHSEVISLSASQQVNAYTDQQVAKALQSSTVYTDQRVNTVKRDASAGTAAAMAMAQLPQSAKYGTSMVSAGGATYDGESAIALGISRMSGNGRWVFKGSASANTRGNYGVGVGVGMHF